MQGTAVECPVCGTKMMIPPGYENMAARCRACNTVLNQGPQLAHAMAGLGAISMPAAAAPAQPVSQSTTEYIKCHLKSALLSSFLWGSAGAIAGGTLMALITVAIMRGADSTQFGATVFGGTEFGVFAGFMLGSVWGLVVGFDLGYGVGAAIAAVLGLIFSVTHHVMEIMFIATPDEPIYLTALVGIGAGAFVGSVSVWYKNYRDNL